MEIDFLKYELVLVLKFTFMFTNFTDFPILIFFKNIYFSSISIRLHNIEQTFDMDLC